MQDQHQASTAQRPEPAPDPRRRRPRGPGRRDQVVRCRLAEEDRTRADQRARAAGLAVAAWLALLGLDAALDRPVLRTEQLDDLRAVRRGLISIGGTVNSMAAAENGGRPVPDLQLAAALARVGQHATVAMRALADAEQVFTGTGPQPGPDRPVEVRSESAGTRRPPAGAGRRDQVVIAKLTGWEREVMAAAATAAGLSVGAWLGGVVEAPDVHRPALIGQQYAAVDRVRVAARQLRTNLGQIEATRTARGAAPLPQLAAAVSVVEELLRQGLAVRNLIAACGQTR